MQFFCGVIKSIPAPPMHETQSSKEKNSSRHVMCLDSPRTCLMIREFTTCSIDSHSTVQLATPLASRELWLRGMRWMNERTASACVVIRRATVIHVLGLWLFVFRVIMMNNKPTISASHLNDARLEWIPIKCERNARCSELCRDYRSLFVDVSRTNCAFFWAAAQRQVAIAGELTNKPSNHIPKRDDQVNILLLWIIIF